MRDLFSLIPQGYRKGCLLVAATVPVKAILDLVGVAALLPVMMLVLDSSKLRGSFLETWFDYLNLDQTAFGAFVIAAVIAVLIVKIALSIAISLYQSKFLMSLYRELSSKLYLSLYSRGLLYIKNQNSARMTFNVIGVCQNFVMGYMGSWMKLAGEVFFMVLILLALFIYSPKATLMSICAFAPATALYLLLVRKPLSSMNKKENDARREQHRLVNESFKGYSEVQVNDAFPQIFSRFVEGLKEISSYRIKGGLIQSIPSYLLEFSVVAAVAVLMMFSFNAANSGNIVFLGVFTVALLKLLPTFRTVISAVSAINATEYTKEVIADMKVAPVYDILHKKEAAALPFNHSISVKNLSFSFPGDDKKVLNGISFNINKGVRFGIKGRTGAGKTTLFNILLGLYMPSEGSVEIDGTPLTVDNVASWHRAVGYVPQEVFIADGSILDNVALGFSADSIDREKVMKVLSYASLSDLVESLPEGIDTKIGESGCRLSGGQRQRLGIARALYKDASVLFFDEATSSLDVQTEMEVNKAIESLSDSHPDLTVIVISHRDSTLSFCDTVYAV